MFVLFNENQGRDERSIELNSDISNGFAERKCAIYEALSRFNESVRRPLIALFG